MKATGERWERRRRREERLERVAAIGERGRCTDTDEGTEYRNRNRPSGGGIWYNRTNIEKPHKHQGLR